MEEKKVVAIERDILGRACFNFLREGEGICVSYGDSIGLNFIVHAVKDGIEITPTEEKYVNGHMLWMKDLKPKDEVVEKPKKKTGKRK